MCTKCRINLLALLILAVISCRPEPPGHSADAAADLGRSLDAERPSPADLVKKELQEGKTLVLAQDNMIRADTVDLMRALTAVLHDETVLEIGLSFMNRSDQEMLDNLVFGIAHPDTAHRLLLSADARFGYAEYRDFLLFVRDFNRQLPINETPLRLVALGGKGKLSPASPSAEGSPLPAFLWARAEELGMLESLLGADGWASSTVLAHHGPKSDMLRWDGLVEAVMAGRDLRDGSYALRTNPPPLADWERDKPDFAADIYVVTPYPYRAVQPIPDFITLQSAEQALEDFPEIRLKKPLPWAASRMNRRIKRQAKQYNREIDKIDGASAPD